MPHFRPTSDERETLKKAVAKYAHDPGKSQLLAGLEVEDSEYDRGVGDWERLKFCVEYYLLHAQTEVRRDPQKKSAKVALAKADALSRKFHPDFS
jgi:hypothetical protein